MPKISLTVLFIGLAIIAILFGVSFYMTYKGKKVPKNINRAIYIIGIIVVILNIFRQLELDAGSTMIFANIVAIVALAISWYRLERGKSVQSENAEGEAVDGAGDEKNKG